ncbi:MAG TPA: Holliday junction resolvase RuvX [Candidatus Aquilonibacter sp.]|nr:Holliday junction resolvase RuvX [Candidatus Aquilonibacter sp.]
MRDGRTLLAQRSNLLLNKILIPGQWATPSSGASVVSGCWSRTPYNCRVQSESPDEGKINRLDDSRRGNPQILPGRVLGLDVGTRRIGMAVSDPLGLTAQGIETLQRRNRKTDFDYLAKVIGQCEVKEIVVGLPLRMSGEEGTQAEKIQSFAAELRKRFGLPVHLWDERLTSVEANRLLRETDLSIEKRGKAVDRMAAVLILQGWMDSRLPASGARLPEADR